MSIKILKVISTKGKNNVCLVSHGEIEFMTTVNYYEQLQEKSEYFFEMGYEAIKNISKIHNYDNNMSGIFPTSSENELCIIGKVSGIHKEENIELVDLYIQKGPEFITIDKKEIPDNTYEIDEGVKIVIIDLILYVHDKK